MNGGGIRSLLSTIVGSHVHPIQMGESCSEQFVSRDGTH